MKHIEDHLIFFVVVRPSGEGSLQEHPENLGLKVCAPPISDSSFTIYRLPFIHLPCSDFSVSFDGKATLGRRRAWRFADQMGNGHRSSCPCPWKHVFRWSKTWIPKSTSQLQVDFWSTFSHQGVQATVHHSVLHHVNLFICLLAKCRKWDYIRLTSSHCLEMTKFVSDQWKNITKATFSQTAGSKHGQTPLHPNTTHPDQALQTTKDHAGKLLGVRLLPGRYPLASNSLRPTKQGHPTRILPKKCKAQDNKRPTDFTEAQMMFFTQ